MLFSSGAPSVTTNMRTKQALAHVGMVLNHFVIQVLQPVQRRQANNKVLTAGEGQEDSGGRGYILVFS